MKNYNYTRRSEYHPASTPISATETMKSYSFPRRLWHHPRQPSLQPSSYKDHKKLELPLKITASSQQVFFCAAVQFFVMPAHHPVWKLIHHPCIPAANGDYRGLPIVSTLSCERLGLPLPEVCICLSMNNIREWQPLQHTTNTSVSTEDLPSTEQHYKNCPFTRPQHTNTDHSSSQQNHFSQKGLPLLLKYDWQHAWNTHDLQRP